MDLGVHTFQANTLPLTSTLSLTRSQMEEAPEAALAGIQKHRAPPSACGSSCAVSSWDIQGVLGLTESDLTQSGEREAESQRPCSIACDH